ncbi:arylsulfatase [Sulfurimonas sp.]|uniref:arylsulfatase n=1 Tax=Sulfurimonas sp. TaxID=2022749 RepID=UPI002AB21765|nr:arylsulfatase [Sulfurimonas sp.]
MKSVILIFTLLSISLSSSFATSTKVQERPNILLIAVDDMGYSDISPFGGEIKTPNINSLAQQGVKFTNFYVGPSCSVTRSMLFSGNDNHVAGLGNMNELLTPNQVGKPGYEGYLNDSVVSIASLLKQAGYHTYMAGKWHLGEEPSQDPSKRGFQRVYTMLQGGTSHFDDEWMMYANYTPTYREDGIRTHVPQGFYSTEFYTKQIIKYMDEQKDDKPFFAYLSFTAPHDPLHVPDEWLDKYKGQYDKGYNNLRKKRLAKMKKLGIIPKSTTLGPWISKVKKWDKLTTNEKKMQMRKMEIYAAMIENIDYHIGRVLKYLKDSGKQKNTLVIFFSDNGANGFEMDSYPNTDKAWIEKNSDNRFSNWGKKGSRIAQGPGWAQASSTPFYLYKNFLAEGGIRSPLIMSGAGVKYKGETMHSMAHVMDLAPTLLELAGAKYPATYKGKAVKQPRGKSMIPLLSKNSSTVHKSDEAIGWEYNNFKAIRIGDYKGIWISKPFGSGKWRIFDLSVDPGESNDLSIKKPKLRQRLIEAWHEYSKSVGVIPPVGGLFGNK